MPILPPLLAEELERSAPGRWRLAPGKRHWRLLIDDCQVTILTRSSRPGRLLDRRMALNQRAAVRRYLARQP